MDGERPLSEVWPARTFSGTVSRLKCRGALHEILLGEQPSFGWRDVLFVTRGQDFKGSTSLWKATLRVLLWGFVLGAKHP